jgi:ketosteroid isomerase-like protein
MQEKMMSSDLDDFEQFMKQRDEAARAFVNGDAAPLGEMVTHNSPATFFGPKGGFDQGADNVYAVYDRDAAHFATGNSTFEILHMAASDGIAYWVGFQRATAQFHAGTEIVQFNLRVTEIFRREGNQWKLIHRHADSLMPEPAGNQK